MHTHRQQAAIAFFAFAGGYADACSYLLYKTFTGHVTGNLVLLFLSAARADLPSAALRLLALVCFLVATALGLRLAAVARASLWLLAAQTLLILPLAAFGLFTGHGPLPGIAAFCLSLGLQNGVVTSSLGVSIHSTYITGDATKLLKLQPTQPASAPAHLLLTLLAGFSLGALAAGLLTPHHPKLAPALLLLPLAIAATLHHQPPQTTSPSH